MKNVGGVDTPGTGTQIAVTFKFKSMLSSGSPGGIERYGTLHMFCVHIVLCVPLFCCVESWRRYKGQVKRPRERGRKPQSESEKEPQIESESE